LSIVILHLVQSAEFCSSESRITFLCFIFGTLNKIISVQNCSLFLIIIFSIFFNFHFYGGCLHCKQGHTIRKAKFFLIVLILFFTFLFISISHLINDFTIVGNNKRKLHIEKEDKRPLFFKQLEACDTPWLFIMFHTVSIVSFIYLFSNDAYRTSYILICYCFKLNIILILFLHFICCGLP
jgi:hypothetical protein